VFALVAPGAILVKRTKVIFWREKSPEKTEAQKPAIMRQLEDGNVWLRVHRAVSYSVALKILGLLNEGEAKE
jgi:hypothetical protein